MSELFSDNEKVFAIVRDYLNSVAEDFDARINAWKTDFDELEKYEVVGSLLARQVTITREFVLSPSIWTEHMTPLVLRAMADVYINMAWILEDSLKRARQFILFGLGQLKLEIEHRKKQLAEDGIDPETDPVSKGLSFWLNSQRYEFLTEVRLGAWSGKSVREMAEEANIIDFYNYVYTPFSANAHSMWHHVGRYNLVMCQNPLHGLHGIPVDPPIEPHTFNLELAAKYLDKTMTLFDTKTKISLPASQTYEQLKTQLSELRDTITTDSSESTSD